MKKTLERIIEKAKNPEKIPVSMYLEEEQFLRIKEICGKKGISVSKFISVLLKDILEHPEEYSGITEALSKK